MMLKMHILLSYSIQKEKILLIRHLKNGGINFTLLLLQGAVLVDSQEGNNFADKVEHCYFCLSISGQAETFAQFIIHHEQICHPKF